MPYPVSPDAPSPEHQPGPRRRSVQFEPTGQQRPGPFRTNDSQPGPAGTGGPQPGQPGQHAADGTTAADQKKGSGAGKKPSSRRDWIWSVVAFVVAAGIIGAVGFYFFGPDSAEATATPWTIEGCAGPEPSAADTGSTAAAYRPLSCDDAEATVTVLDIQDAVSVGQLHCPAGTDVVFQKDGHAGGVTQAVCARNLSDDHPGDPGMGGGQLLPNDCVNGQGGEVPCSADGANKVVSLVVGDGTCPENATDKIELGFDPERSYATICLGGQA